MKKGSRITEMALCSVATVMLVFAISLGTHSASPRLLGCQNPTTIADALRKFREVQWRNVSTVQLWEVWPTRLTPIDCDAVGCKSASSEDRIIAAKCECCEIFYLNKEEGSSQPEHLENIIIHYSASERRDAIEGGKSLHALLGSRRPMLRWIGQQSQQHFEWDSNEANIYFAVEIHLNKRDNLWDLYLNLGTGALNR